MKSKVQNSENDRTNSTTTFFSFSSNNKNNNDNNSNQNNTTNNHKNNHQFNGDTIMGDEELVNVSWKTSSSPPKSSSTIGISTTVSSPFQKAAAFNSNSIAKQYGYQYEYSNSSSHDGSDDNGYYYDDDEEDDQDKNEAKSKSSTTTTTSESLFSKIASTIQMDDSYNNPNNIPYKIHLLGKIYHPILDYTLRREDETNLFWFSYRCDFVEIKPNGITSDAGWGCMLRSAQMLFSQALKVHYNGRKYKAPKSTIRRKREEFIQDLCMWFADFPSVADDDDSDSGGGCWYSLHNMVAAGLTKYDVLPGEWFGPGIASHVMKDLAELHERWWKKKYQKNNNANDTTSTNGDQQKNNPRVIPSHFVSSNEQSSTYQRDKQPVMRVYVAPEGSVYRQEIEQLMTKDSIIDNNDDSDETPACSETEDNDDSYEKVNLEDIGVARSTTKSTIEKNPLSHPLADFDQQEIKQDIPWDTGLLILIPLRLGLKTFNASSYKIPLSHVLSFPQSVGFVGGAPRHALYFFGSNSDGSKVYGLDPHTVQRAPRRRRLRPEEAARTGHTKKYQVQLTDEYLRSLNCPTISSFDMARIDPSLALGFYCRDKADFESFCVLVEEMKTKDCTKDYPPLFSVAEAKPDYNADLSSAMMDMIDGGSSSQLEDDVDNNEDEDDFVML